MLQRLPAPYASALRVTLAVLFVWAECLVGIAYAARMIGQVGDRPEIGTIIYLGTLVFTVVPFVGTVLYRRSGRAPAETASPLRRVAL